jgi:hypothetical protein
VSSSPAPDLHRVKADRQDGYSWETDFPVTSRIAAKSSAIDASFPVARLSEIGTPPASRYSKAFYVLSAQVTHVDEVPYRGPVMRLKVIAKYL